MSFLLTENRVSSQEESLVGTGLLSMIARSACGDHAEYMAFCLARMKDYPTGFIGEIPLRCTEDQPATIRVQRKG